MPLMETAKPLRFANSPPVVMGQIMGSFVIWLNGVGETISTGRVPCCSCPEVGSSETK
jgi:hypothetical protein